MGIDCPEKVRDQFGSICYKVFLFVLGEVDSQLNRHRATFADRKDPRVLDGKKGEIYPRWFTTRASCSQATSEYLLLIIHISSVLRFFT